MSPKRVCVIGAGPGGCSVLVQYQKLVKAGVQLPEIVCLEKQNTWGGLWNFTWRTGADQYGQPVHGGMYRHLWSNGPKECVELADYTFDEHFKRPIPSFPPRTAIFDYLKGRWNKHGIHKMITFNQMVESVEFMDNTNQFKIVVQDLVSKTSRVEMFDYVIACGGHFSTPNVPEFPGVESFPGRVIHSHDFRDARQFKGQRVLVVGGSYSAEDIALQTNKFGASHVTITARKGPMDFDWPRGIDEKPILKTVDGSDVTFKDGTTSTYDAIILCTGYYINAWFMEHRLRLRGMNPLYQDDCYKGVVYMPYATGRLFYIAYQDQYYTFPMFDLQAFYTLGVITGAVPLPPLSEMREDWQQWRDKRAECQGMFDEIDFQTEYLEDLKQTCGYEHKLDVSDLIKRWDHDKQDSILTYRDQQFTSIHTGTKSSVHHTPWFQAMSDSLEEFLKQSK